MFQVYSTVLGVVAPFQFRTRGEALESIASVANSGRAGLRVIHQPSIRNTRTDAPAPRGARILTFPGRRAK